MPVQYAIQEPFVFEGAQIFAQNIIFALHNCAIPAHSHGSGCYEIHFIPAGHGTLQVCGSAYEIAPGTLYVTGPHLSHAQAPDPKDPMQEYCIYLCLESSGHSVSPLVHAFCDVSFWLGTDSGVVHNLMRQIFNEFLQQCTGYRTQVKLLLGQLIIELARRYEDSNTPTQSFSPAPICDPNTLLIEECFLYEYRTLSLPTLAARLHLSPRQTQRILKNIYGSTFQKMKNEARLSAAIAELQSKASITAIAETLGFSSPEHFTHAFRTYYGCSPRAWRKTL